ncbi:MAG: hypothetical protein H6599_09520 [Flavobacteriales bacterium]|nr:hypothetical protein [Flavobacteriales bacterium]
MSETFKRTLRTKTAEQLSNMFRNKEGWTKDEYLLIETEIKNRGLEVFEEPEEWSDEEMERVDLINPQSDFEKNLAFLTKEKDIEKGEKGIRLAAQILSIASMFVSFSYLYWYLEFTYSNGITTIMKISLLATLAGITSLILFILKKHLASVILSAVSLITTLIALVFYLEYVL